MTKVLVYVSSSSVQLFTRVRNLWLAIGCTCLLERNISFRSDQWVLDSFIVINAAVVELLASSQAEVNEGLALGPQCERLQASLTLRA